MKKLSALVLAVLLVAGAAIAFTGCSSSSGDLKLGFASKTTISMSKDLADKDGVKSGTAQADTMMCSVIVDKAGKVVKITIDTVQSPITFDETGKITTDKAATFQTKREKGDGYGMKKASKIGKEWYEQVDAIQKWMTGKTAEQIKAMKVKTTEAEGNVADEADLTSSATIGIDEFIEVATAAIANAK
jgi:hypothetical protein